ncbi:DUF6907 domain-containing protein [Streptomyces noursei]|uniref:DUF6907 domain-containing protein n=1 Tax=Streptomyces noursei TaxID=1971 RepID=UPI001672413F|nr:hypothetical protein [Streptomyces noursei]MCZ1013987.1 hypothetical protein [Streptomyces noursei]GGX40366.1 hypothetical protein GCM10010341_72840 [Streptomyces noursei]
MTVLHESPVVPAQSAPGRQVAISIRGQQVTVDCPSWCAYPHSEVYGSLEDVSHHGPAISLTAPSHCGAVEAVLAARVSSWPFAGDVEAAGPFVAFDPVNDEVAQLTPAALTALADQVVAHGYALRAMAASIAG